MSSRDATRSPGDRHLGTGRAWLVVTRAPTLLTTLGAALVGALLALHVDGAAELPAVLALLLVVVAHLCGNLLAALSGRPTGAPRDVRSRAARLLASGRVPRRHVGLAVIALVLAGAALLVALALVRGWPVVALAAAGALLAGARALRPGLPGLAELDPLVLRGPLLVAGTFFATAGSLPWQVWLAGVPWGLLCASARLGEQLDRLPDGGDPRSLAARLGGSGARVLTLVLLVAVYAVTGVAVALGALPWPALLVALALPLLRSVAGTLRRRPAPPRPDGPARSAGVTSAVARHLRAFGGLLVLGVAVAALLDVGAPGLGS